MDIKHLLSHHIPRHLPGTLCILSLPEWESCTPRLLGARDTSSTLLGNRQMMHSCRLPTSPPPQILFMAQFCVSPTLPLQFSPPFLLPDKGHEPLQDRYSPTPGRSPAAPTRHSNLPSSTCLHTQQFCDVTVDKVTFGINWRWRACSK